MINLKIVVISILERKQHVLVSTLCSHPNKLCTPKIYYPINTAILGIKHSEHLMHYVESKAIIRNKEEILHLPQKIHSYLFRHFHQNPSSPE